MGFIKEFFGYFLGEHSGVFHIAGVLFCLIGALVTKRHYWLRHKAQHDGVCEHPEFDSRYWLKNNWANVAYTVLISFAIVRFIDVFLHMIELHDVTILGVTIPVTADTVFYYLLFGVMVQIWMHIKYKKKSTGVGIQGTVDPTKPGGGKT